MPPVFWKKLVCPECKKERIPIVRWKVKQHVINLWIDAWIYVCGKFNPDPLEVTVVR